MTMSTSDTESPSEMDQELQKYLNDFPSLVLDKEKKKLQCRFTSHEMPATVSAVKSYVNGKKYRKAAQHHAYNFEQFKPHLMPSTKKRHFHELFCHLTLRHIGRTPQDVERHVKGKKYKGALKKWQECQKSGEKFVPRAGGRQKKKIKSEDSDQDSLGGLGSEEEDMSDEEEKEDDLSDLYPDKIFSKAESSGEEDVDIADKKVDKKTKKNGKSKNPAPVQDKEDSDSDYDMSVLEELANQSSGQEEDSEEGDDSESEEDEEENSEVASDLDNGNNSKEVDQAKSKSDTKKSKSRKRLNSKPLLAKKSKPSKKKKKISVEK